MFDPDDFFNYMLPKFVKEEGKEEYPLMYPPGNIYRGNYSLIMKAIKVAHGIGYNKGIEKAERAMFNEYASKN